MSLLHSLYQLLTLLLSPFIKGLFLIRVIQGKEEKSRLNERWGIPALEHRPKGPIYWIHAVSVGEANSALILVKLLQQLDPQAHILMTTGTVTSAKLMAERLPQGATHQYLPKAIPPCPSAHIFPLQEAAPVDLFQVPEQYHTYHNV